jgi:uncharacterized lipoprotein NlpE involved in copper resistance
MKVKQVLLGFLLVVVVVVGCNERSKVPQKEAEVGVEQVVIIETFLHARMDETVESRVNAWLRKNSGRVEIVRVFQSQHGSFITFSIFYKRIK